MCNVLCISTKKTSIGKSCFSQVYISTILSLTTLPESNFIFARVLYAQPRAISKKAKRCSFVSLLFPEQTPKRTFGEKAQTLAHSPADGISRVGTQRVSIVSSSPFQPRRGVPQGARRIPECGFRATKPSKLYCDNPGMPRPTRARRAGGQEQDAACWANKKGRRKDGNSRGGTLGIGGLGEMLSLHLVSKPGIAGGSTTPFDIECRSFNPPSHAGILDTFPSAGLFLIQISDRLN